MYVLILLNKITFISRQHFITQLFPFALEVSWPTHPYERNWPDLCADTDIRAACTTWERSGGVCMWQVCVRSGTSFQVWHRHRPSPSAVERETPETHPGTGQDQAMGAKHVRSSPPVYLQEKRKFQWGWSGPEGFRRGRIQRNAEGQHGPFGVWMVVWESWVVCAL